MTQSPTKYVTQIRKHGGKGKGGMCVCVCVCSAFQAAKCERCLKQLNFTRLFFILVTKRPPSGGKGVT